MTIFNPWNIRYEPAFFRNNNMAIDLYEKGNKLILKAEIPGIGEKDIEVSEQDGYLTIRARRITSQNLQRSGWQRLEQQRSNWERRILLPTKINTNRSKAYIDNGVLTIIFPIESPEKSLMKRIKVNMPSVKLPDIGKKSGKIKVHHK